MRQMQGRSVRRSAREHAPLGVPVDPRNAGPRSGAMSMSELGAGHEAG